MPGEELEILCGFLDLGVNELGQGADELRRRIEVFCAFVVDELSDCVPEGGLEALRCVSNVSQDLCSQSDSNHLLALRCIVVRSHLATLTSA